jgi:hypothetical protein
LFNTIKFDLLPVLFISLLFLAIKFFNTKCAVLI